MTPTAPQPSSPITRSAPVVLLPGEKFFVRRIPLTPGQDAALQVELALETFGPFSPAQIFHGFCAAQDGKTALLFAAYRKNFTADEMASWATAEVVLPEFALWLAPATPPDAGTWLYENHDVLHLIALDGGELPAGLLFRKTDQASAELAAGELQEEAVKRLGVPAGTLRRMSGNFVIERWSKEGLSLKLDKPGQAMAALLPVARVRSMDVRDKAELARLAQQQQHTQWLWRAFAGIAAALVLLSVLELGLRGAGFFLAKQQRVLEANAGVVQQLKQAEALANRMEQMAGQRLKPFGMLAFLNEFRPKSLTFIRTKIEHVGQIEVEAQTNNAAEVSSFEQILKKAPEIEQVEVSDQHIRDGVTTFQLHATFKTGFPAE